MTRQRFKVPKEIRSALDATGLPWPLTMGARGHAKIKLAGHLVATLSSRASVPNSEMLQNALATIRRTSRNLGGQ